MVNVKYNFWNPTDLCQMTAWKLTGGYIAPKKTKQVEAKKIQKVKLTYCAKFIHKFWQKSQVVTHSRKTPFNYCKLEWQMWQKILVSFQALTKEINQHIEKDVRSKAGKFEPKSFHIVKHSEATSSK